VVAAARKRAASFGGGGAITGFRAGGVDGYKGLARRMKKALRQAPLIVPNLRITVGELVTGRTFRVEPPPVAGYFAPP
nr:hypothetical protein [Kofleriaceae bacterium]